MGKSCTYGPLIRDFLESGDGHIEEHNIFDGRLHPGISKLVEIHFFAREMRFAPIPRERHTAVLHFFLSKKSVLDTNLVKECASRSVPDITIRQPLPTKVKLQLEVPGGKPFPGQTSLLISWLTTINWRPFPMDMKDSCKISKGTNRIRGIIPPLDR